MAALVMKMAGRSSLGSTTIQECFIDKEARQMIGKYLNP